MMTSATAETAAAGTLTTAHGEFQFVYVPPHFRLRVFLFILFIWLFAAATGVAFTIVPLVFGRQLFQRVTPTHVRTNDVYAFSIGVYVLGSTAYFLFHARALWADACRVARFVAATVTVPAVVRAVGQTTWRVLRLVYAYFFILVVFPLLATALVELYVLIPLHTYMYPESTSSPSSAAPESRHTVRIIQSWTLGLLYLKLIAYTATAWYGDTRLAAAIRAVLRRGQLDPDVRLLTRAFVVPATVLALVTIVLPTLLAGFLDPAGSGASAGSGVGSTAGRHLLYRLSFPFVALVAAGVWSLWGMVDVFGSWKVRIRDEAYLIGERLHNFGAASGPQARRAWRGGRL